jgi:hypothetical protein
MICPKCGFEQPDGPDCMRCGIVVSRYKGPTVGTGSSPVPPPPPAFSPGGYQPAAPPPPPPFSVGQTGGPPPPPPPLPSAGGTRYDDPAPGFGTVYAGPLPTPGAAGGTVYGGPPAIGYAGPGAGTRAAAAFNTGGLLAETFKIYFSNVIPFVILTFLALSPVILFAAWATSRGAEDPLAVAAEPLSNLFTVLLAPLATAAITYGVFQQMRGGSPSLGDCLKVGLSSLLPVLGLVIVQGCVVGLAALACVVPGLILAVRWAVAVPAAVEEKPGVGEALNRSTYLTEGYRWQVFGVLAVLYVINIGLVFALGAGLVAAGGGTTAASVFLLLENAVTVVTTGFAATASSVMYYRLRSVKESIDVDQIASVFA